MPVDETPLKRSRPGGVRSRLFLLVVGCILPVALAAALLVYIPYQREHALIRDASISRMRATVSALDREFLRIEAALLALSTLPMATPADLGAFYGRATLAVASINVDSIVVLDETGQLLLSTRRPNGAPLPKLEEAPLFRKIVATGEPGVSDLYGGTMTGTLLIRVGVPVRVDGAITRSLYATIEPERLFSVLAEQKLPDTWRTSIVDSTGAVVARTHDIAKFLGKKVNPDLLKRLSESSEAAFETRTLDGIPVLTSYSRSQRTGWSVVVGTPLAELTAGIRETLLWLVAAICAALAIGIGLAWVLGERIARSISALVAPAKALGLGRPVRVPELHLKEADDVGNALMVAAAALDEAKYNALHDALTALANRTSFQLTVERQLALSERNRKHLSVLYADLDGFKGVNDRHGHAAGDELLRMVASRLKETVRASDLVARLGGDEFAIGLIDCDAQSAMAFAQRLAAVLSSTYHVAGVDAAISVSIGVAVYPESATDYDTLIRRADRAMYAAKASGKGQVCLAPSSNLEISGRVGDA